MNIEVRKSIDKLADKVRRQWNIEIPITSLDEIVHSMGGEISESASVLDAKIVPNGNSFVILISPSNNKKRQKFTIAHELGHLFYHMGFYFDKDKWETGKRQEQFFHCEEFTAEEEYEANQFAASFLMPEDEFILKIRELRQGSQINIEDLASAFAVSHDAVLNRGRSLRIFPW